MAVRILAGYPQYVGDKIEMMVDIDGPTSYVNTNTFGTSGQQINASDLGLGGIEWVSETDISSDGANSVAVVLGATTAGATNLSPAPPSSPGYVATSFVAHWQTTALGGTESTNGTNLSGKYMRYLIRGV